MIGARRLWMRRPSTISQSIYHCLRMARYLDHVPFSGIIRIRDMMYSVDRPFRLDQGDVSFDAPDSVKARADPGRRRKPHALRPDDRHSAAARSARREAAARGTAFRSAARTRSWSRPAAFTASTSICQGLLEPGDEVLVPDPEWPPAAGNCSCAHAVPVPVSAARIARAGGRIVDEMRRLVTPKTRAIYVNSPNNPTGGVLTRADLEAIADARARAQSLGASPTKPTKTSCSTARARQHRVAAGHVRAHDSALHVQQDLRDDRPAARLHRRQGRDDPRSRAQDALLHGVEHLVADSVRRRRRAGGLAGGRRRVPARAGRAARSVLRGHRDAPRRGVFSGRRRPARSTRFSRSIRRGARRCRRAQLAVVGA